MTLPRSNDPIVQKAISIPCPKCNARPQEPCRGMTPIHQQRYVRAAKFLSDQAKLAEWNQTYGKAESR